MARLGRVRPFKPALPIISNEWYAYLNPILHTTTVNAGVAVAVGQAPPQVFVFRADACCAAYNATAITAVIALPSVATATGTAYGSTISIVINAGSAGATATANNGNTNYPIDWVSTEAIAWVSGEDVDWVYET